MNSVYRRAGWCGVALALGLAPIVASLSPAAAAPTSGGSTVGYDDRCDGGVDVTLSNEHDSGNVVYTVNEDVVVVAPGQRSQRTVAAAAGGNPLVVQVALQDRDGKEERTAHRWKRPGDCDDPGARRAIDPHGQSTSGAADGDGYAADDGDGYAADDADGDGYAADDTGTAADDDGYGDAADDGYGDGGAAGDGYGAAADGDGFDYGVDAVDQGVTGQAATATALDPSTAHPAAAALAVTGTNTVRFGAAGVLLILFGAALLRMRRRRVAFEAD
ncbi:hypothetical protein ACQP00_09845 [Dactylosporangium sp. CS-047395]|uniref:hypothetical protein n=1 Tax=Dactylosporangium sp. CS-047395 TaxID=3239936 RepID=UPI003D8B9282